MNSLTRIVVLSSLVAASLSRGQSLPSSMSFLVSGKFQNAVAESGSSILITDNNLTNGYASGTDLHNAPSGLTANGPAGSAFFQWGTASTTSSYAHPSAIWFSSIAVNNVTLEQTFDLGYIYYRNGTINAETGASKVDFTLTFNIPGLPGPIESTFTSNLINTPNTGTAEQNADIVSLVNSMSPTAYKDGNGNTYYLKLAVDEATLQNSLSTESEFRVVEGSVGRATLTGTFTTGIGAVPEPSSAILAGLGTLVAFRRRR